MKMVIKTAHLEMMYVYCLYVKNWNKYCNAVCAMPVHCSNDNIDLYIYIFWALKTFLIMKSCSFGSISDMQQLILHTILPRLRS